MLRGVLRPVPGFSLLLVLLLTGCAGKPVSPASDSGCSAQLARLPADADRRDPAAQCVLLRRGVYMDRAGEVRPLEPVAARPVHRPSADPIPSLRRTTLPRGGKSTRPVVLPLPKDAR